MEQMVNVAGQRTAQIRLNKALHANGALWSATLLLRDAIIVNLFEAAFIAGVFAPVARIASLEAILHVSVDLTTVLAKDELF